MQIDSDKGGIEQLCSTHMFKGRDRMKASAQVN